MDVQEVLEELKTLGTAQNQKIYRKHGVGEELYGVSFADLDRLKKKIRTDHALAQALWQSGIHDARILATKVADPATMDEGQLDSWVRDLENYVISDAFSGLASKAPLARQKMEQWTKSEEEWVGRTGWLMLANLAMRPQSYQKIISRLTCPPSGPALTARRIMSAMR